jgi:hypothetical protein
LAVPAELQKVFVKLENAIANVIRKTEKGIIPREDFSLTEKEIGKIKSSFEGLAESMDGIKNASDKKLS